MAAILAPLPLTINNAPFTTRLLQRAFYSIYLLLLYPSILLTVYQVLILTGLTVVIRFVGIVL